MYQYSCTHQQHPELPQQHFQPELAAPFPAGPAASVEHSQSGHDFDRAGQIHPDQTAAAGFPLGPAKQVTKPMLTAIKGVGFDPWLSKEEWPADAKVQVVLR